MRQEVNPRVVPPFRLGEDGVQYGSADSPAPPFGNDVEQVEEGAAGYNRTCPIPIAQSAGGGHRDHHRSLGRDKKP